MSSSHFTTKDQHDGKDRKREYVNRCLPTSKTSQKSRCQRLIIHFTFVHKLTVCFCCYCCCFSLVFVSFLWFYGVAICWIQRDLKEKDACQSLQISLFRPVKPFDWASVWPKPFSNLAMNSTHTKWTSALFMECLLAMEWLINATTIKWHINFDWKYLVLFAFTWNFVEWRKSLCVRVCDGRRHLYAKSIKWQFEICVSFLILVFISPRFRVWPLRFEKNILIKPKNSY